MRAYSPLAIDLTGSSSNQAKTVASHDWSHSNGMWCDAVTFDDGSTETFCWAENENGQPGPKI